MACGIMVPSFIINNRFISLVIVITFQGISSQLLNICKCLSYLSDRYTAFRVVYFPRYEFYSVFWAVVREWPEESVWMWKRYLKEGERDMH